MPKITVTKNFTEEHKEEEIVKNFIKQRIERLKKKFKNVETSSDKGVLTFKYEAK